VKTFLCNSGAEANECIIKIARKYGATVQDSRKHRIVTLTGSFHGRTIATLAATGQDKFHADFGPFPEGFVYIAPGDTAALDAALDAELVCGFLLEPIQGEGGVHPVDAEYIRTAARLCAERNILLMYDEVQCGVGRTGTFFAGESLTDVKPDLVSLAKGLAGGVPVGAALAGSKCAAVLAPGDHGSTFGGSPLAAAAACVVLDTVSQPAFLAEVARKGALLAEALRQIPCVAEVRGKGLMLGADIDRPARGIVEKAADAGLLVLSAGEKTLRFLPPLNATESELAEAVSILRKIIL
jgi:acetylornithine/N-succinyldiaminopimelate aminotransferase